MAEIEKNVHAFLNEWFAGLLQGLEALDGPSQSKVLHECGKACARSYTAQVFREAKQDSVDMATFLQALSRRFPEASYEQVGSNVIRVTYARCGCDLVRLGLVTSPILCECSAANLCENFEQALGVPASVTIESSILRGEPQCVLVVSLEHEI
jgi:hypothetical protein